MITLNYCKKCGLDIQPYNYGGKTLFDFQYEEKINLTYRNQGANCWLCAICDVVNVSSNKMLLKPVELNNSNRWKYNRVASFRRSDMINVSLKSKLNDLPNKCVITICCNGGYHSIAYVDGLFYNNWSNRNGLTYEELLYNLHYNRSPKIATIETDIISLIDKCNSYDLLIAC